jgi:hypothetical protein
MSSALKIDRTLRKNAPEASTKKGYDLDAEAIAKVLVRHYGDEADSVLKQVLEWLPAARRMKR